MDKLFNIGDIVTFKLNGDRAMILAIAPIGSMGMAPMYDAGYIIRLSSTLQELYVRYHEVEEYKGESNVS